MTVKELITALLECGMSSEVYLYDDVSYTDENEEEVDGTLYKIDEVEHGVGSVYIVFDNYQHYKKKENK